MTRRKKKRSWAELAGMEKVGKVWRCVMRRGRDERSAESTESQFLSSAPRRAEDSDQVDRWNVLESPRFLRFEHLVSTWI